MIEPSAGCRLPARGDGHVGLALFRGAPLYLRDGKAMLPESPDLNVMVNQEISARSRIVVNGEPYATAARTLADLLVEAGYGGIKVATAVNGAFVPEVDRGRWPIAHGDRVEIVSPRQGG